MNNNDYYGDISHQNCETIIGRSSQQQRFDNGKDNYESIFYDVEVCCGLVASLQSHEEDEDYSRQGEDNRFIDDLNGMEST